MNSKACLKLIHNNNFYEKEECIFEKSTKLDLNPFIEEERNYFPKLDKSCGLSSQLHKEDTCTESFMKNIYCIFELKHGQTKWKKKKVCKSHSDSKMICSDYFLYKEVIFKKRKVDETYNFVLNNLKILSNPSLVRKNIVFITISKSVFKLVSILVF